MDVQYKIIGGDGAEYGPASLDELQSWIGDGRVAGSTQVWRNDLAHWSPAARYIELQQALARLHASISPSLAAQASRPVGFWPRLGAYLMDRMVLMLALFLLWGPVSAWAALDDARAPHRVGQKKHAAVCRATPDQQVADLPVLFLP